MITVETTGQFQLYDRHNQTLIPPGKPVEVEQTPFVSERIGTGELRVVAVENEKPKRGKKAEPAKTDDTAE